MSTSADGGPALASEPMASPRIYVVQGMGVRFARDLGRSRPDQRGRTKRRVQIEGAAAPTWVDEAQIFGRAVDAKAARQRAVAYRNASAPSLTITEALIELAGQPEPTAASEVGDEVLDGMSAESFPAAS